MKWHMSHNSENLAALSLAQPTQYSCLPGTWPSHLQPGTLVTTAMPACASSLQETGTIVVRQCCREYVRRHAGLAPDLHSQPGLGV